MNESQQLQMGLLNKDEDREEIIINEKDLV